MKNKTIVDSEGKVIGIAMDAKGNPIVVMEGKGENGADKEIGLDAIHLYSKVPALQDEAKGHRVAKESLKALVDIAAEAGVNTEDPAEFKSWIENATTSIETVKNFDDKKLVDAKEIETLKRSATEASEKKLKELENSHQNNMNKAKETIGSLQNAMFDLMVSDKFSSSKFVSEKLNMPAKVAKAYFGQNFKVEKTETGGYHVVPYMNGEKLFSEERLGEMPDFDEAIGLMVAKDDARDSLMVGSGSGGSGAGAGGKGGGQGGGESNPWVKGPNYNLTKQGELFQKDPVTANRMMEEAKVINSNSN
jgi:hypothetical protein